MASVASLRVLNQAAVAATTTSAASSMDARTKDHALVVISANHSSSNYSVQFQHSPDGENWIALGSAFTVNSNAIQFAAVTVPVMANVRVVATRTAGTVDLDCRLVYDIDK